MMILPRISLNLESRERLVSIVLRSAVAVAFTYPPIAAFMNPEAWLGFIPLFIRDVVPDDVLFLHLFGISELLIAAWILFARRIFIPSVLASIYLLGILALNWQYADLLFRDISILGASVALALRSK